MTVATMPDSAALQRRLDELAAKHRVVGASFALLHGDDVVEAATGIANLRSGMPATTDTLFQIGSITKLYTATLIMQLAERGALDIDAPIARALPELRLSEPSLVETITPRHLLTHTSGIDGDHFRDYGRGDDAIARYVASLDQIPQLFAPGQMCSYSNAGWVVLGRVIEVLLGTTWDRALADNLLRPLGCDHSVTLPEEAILHPVAIGHLPGEGGDVSAPRPTPLWSLPRSTGPAGHITATARDVLRFARMHLLGGVAGDGTSLLSSDTVRAMQQPQVALIDRMLGDFWALGWFGSHLDGEDIVGHDGTTIGQAAFLRVLPSHDLALVLLTTGGFARALYEELFNEVVAERAGITLPRTPAIPSSPVPANLDHYAGAYERHGFRYAITAAGDGTLLLTPTLTVDDPLMGLALVPQLRMVPLRDSTFVCYPPALPAARSTATFFDLPGGTRWIHIGARAARKVD